jgi:LAO/AO transport system kinase
VDQRRNKFQLKALLLTQEHKSRSSAISVMDGVSQPPSVNKDSVNKFKKLAVKNIDPEEVANSIFEGNVSVLSRAITLVESSLSSHQVLAEQIIERCVPRSGNSRRIGITGVPGVGKSTFIEALGSIVTAGGSKLAVLAIDPSSERSKGSILGDKTRMEKLAANASAFIRPSPSAGSLGGVARKTRETVILCEAAGFDTIFIETVGVGQSEVSVHSMVDFFLLLLLPGSGDELQGIKRGIMEMADSIAITKADGSNLDKSKQALTEFTAALHLFPPSPFGWIPKVVTCSAKENLGLLEVWQVILDYLQQARNSGYFEARRKDQSKYWMHETIVNTITSSLYTRKHLKDKIAELEQMLYDNKLTPFQAARLVLDLYFSKSGK